ncbi:hypothetical protein OCF84_21685 (plasmid) [Shewanella xiamenensis]|uniref:Uncharacterized protein n=1 Tax=Shewanella xiamenensis TaxID=332186 RepID=A0ABT6UDG3_9GAMM|nr:hypothetical protein [Shewanella xiamenensis]MDI5832509.1 hypothetical protein [Shewanella xiamenensis]WHF57872.1 hypothetical protein OCF84_21685 [Shewanella xiamenensis]
MNIEIYETQKNNIYLAIEKGAMLSGLTVPKQLMPKKLFKEITVTPSSKLIGINPASMMTDISKHGYSLIEVVIRVTE